MKLNVKILPNASLSELEELIEIDRENFQADPSENAFEWLINFPWMYTLIKRQTENGWKTKGYGVIIPTTKLMLEGLKRGDFGEDEIKSKDIRLPNNAEGFYVASIATKKDITTYESSRLVGNLTGSILRAQVPILAVAITKSGERVGLEVGLKTKLYKGSVFQGVEGYQPRILENKPFIY